MATQTLDQAIRELADKETESELTICIMRQVAARLDLRDPELFDSLYETVIFYTGNWQADQGWGTSDTSAVVRSYVESHRPNNLHPNIICGQRDAFNAIEQAKTTPIAIALDTFCIQLIPEHLYIVHTTVPHITYGQLMDKTWRSHPIYSFSIDDDGGDTLIISRFYTHQTKVRISLYDPKIKQKINRYTRKPKSGVANNEQ